VYKANLKPLNAIVFANYAPVINISAMILQISGQNVSAVVSFSKDIWQSQKNNQLAAITLLKTKWTLIRK
jgi:hypothetical protein